MNHQTKEPIKILFSLKRENNTQKDLKNQLEVKNNTLSTENLNLNNKIKELLQSIKSYNNF